MLNRSKILFFLTTAALVAACGGGGTPNTTTGGSGNPGDGSSGTPDTAPDQGSIPADQQLNGHLAMVANSVLYVRGDRTMYLPVDLSRFEGERGINDVAPGFDGTPSTADPYTGKNRDEPPGTYAVDETLGPAAPLAAFGIRFDRLVQPNSPGEDVRNQTAVGRLAVELVERSDLREMENGQAEVIRYVINGVELKTDANGAFSASVLPNSQMEVYGRNANGVEVTDTLLVPTDAVSLLPMSRVPDSEGDDTSVVLLFDFEKAFPEDANRLAALQQISGFFDMRVTLSAAQMVRPALADGSRSRKELIGQEITINDQPAVRGGGVVGKAWIRTYDLTPPPDQP